MTATPIDMPRRIPGANPLEQRVRDLESDLAIAVERITALADRVADLEANRPVVRVDTPGERVHAWMAEHSGLKVTALIVGEAIGEDNAKVGNRLASLAAAGELKTSKAEGRTRFYWHEAATS